MKTNAARYGITSAFAAACVGLEVASGMPAFGIAPLAVVVGLLCGATVPASEDLTK